jgi:hypothetical protein
MAAGQLLETTYLEILGGSEATTVKAEATQISDAAPRINDPGPPKSEIARKGRKPLVASAFRELYRNW